MKKLIVFVMAGMFAFSPLVWASAAPGPALNSGDGVSDGSGLEMPNGPIGAGSGSRPGPAPDSGDGVSDGSEFDSDYFDCLIGS